MKFKIRGDWQPDFVEVDLLVYLDVANSLGIPMRKGSPENFQKACVLGLVEYEDKDF